MELAMEAIKPYLVIISVKLCLAVFMAILHTVVSQGVSAIVLVVYENVLSSIILSSIALLFERRKRPKPSLKILAWAFFVGSLEVPLGQLMLTASLRYITVSFQSVAMNTIPVMVFVLAVAARREQFQFWGLQGQAKLWGILTSAAGATVMVVSSSSNDQAPTQSNGSLVASTHYIGFIMVGIGVLAQALGSFFVEQVALKYPAVLTLSAMMNVFGMLQTAAVAAFMERNPSSWEIRWGGGSLQLPTILFGGIAVTGLSYYAQNWCIQKKGPVFVSAFLPLLIVFSFLLETVVMGSVAHLGSILGALLVIGGLYLLLWAKSKDYKKENIEKGGLKHPFEDSSIEPLLSNNV